MSLSVQSLNGDTSFLLTCDPPAAPLSSPGLFPGSFTILVDPWLTGPSIILNSIFSHSEQRAKPSISSLEELDRDPDLVLISQDKPDHCHEATLRQLSPDSESTILAIPAAAKKIRAWKHFRPDLVHALPRYVQGDGRSVYRIVLPPPTPRGTCGEVTVTWIPAKRDLSKVHHAIGITYRPPCTVLSSLSPMHYIDLPMSPPLSPASTMTFASSPSTIFPSPFNDREKTLSVIYSPHGVSFDVLRPYASSFLVSESALPLTALLHSFDTVENPWWLGGNISAGSPGGTEIAKSLYAKAWISAHDADKDNRGWAVKLTQIAQHAVDEIKKRLDEGVVRKTLPNTDVISLASGEQHRIAVG
ncbi:Zn-dependent hydrolase beta-lactamase protein [Pyrenophora teres f. maculata]|nr:Zn-dependent hydrolase beta-lactamase protein [Pyrenophora teres f. maculata]